MTRTKLRKLGDSYLELIHRFPLRPIRNDGEHAVATDVVQGLLGRKLDRGEADYLDALLVFVNQYEDAQHAIDESMTAAETIRALMEANNMTQAEMARIIGSQSAVSMMLSGARQPSKVQIARLCARFRLSADLFIGQAA